MSDHLALDGGDLVVCSEGRAFVRPAKSSSGRLSDKHLTHPKYRADIDGLRAIAVLSVVGFHAFPHLIRGGLIGVDIFFVISGFLISTIVFDSLDRKCFSFAEFYSRRIRRIFPALIVVLIAIFAFGWFALLADEYKQLGKHIAAGAAFVSNFVFWNESGYFDNAAASKPLLHLWSLGVEEQFYLVWPLLLWVAWQKRFNLLIIAVLVAVISFALNAQGIGKDAVATFYSPQTRFWELMVGSMLAWLALHRGGTLPKLWQAPAFRSGKVFDAPASESTNSSALRNVLSFSGAALIAAALIVITRETNFPGWWALLPTFGAALIIASGSQALLNRALLSNRVLVWFGLISFPLYLWHWPLLSFADIVQSETPSREIRIGAVLASVALAWATYKLVETPLRFGKYGKLKALALFGVMAAIGLGGYETYQHDGIEFRSAVKLYKNNKNELIRTPVMDDECLSYLGNNKPLFPYCRFTDASSPETIAVIGDSHAHSAYPGIAEFMLARKINTVLLANSGCPPFLGAEYGRNDEEKNACKRRIEAILNIIVQKKDIKTVFIFSRGPLYITGKYFAEEEEKEKGWESPGGPYIDAKVFYTSLQNTIDRLRAAGKDVYYVTENPEIALKPSACIPRPFRITYKSCDVDLAIVQARQKQYLEIIRKLSKVTIVDTLSAFCPKHVCTAFRNGKLLYADYSHLSLAGSTFQAVEILRKYLEVPPK